MIEDEISVLIDTGAGEEALGQLARPPDVIINSHFHADHIRGNYLFPRANVWAAVADAAAIRSQACFLIDSGYSRLGNERARWMLARAGYRESRVDRELAGGERLDLGRRSLTVIPIPGHTPGHLAFYLEPEGILVSADADLTSFGPWYGSPRSNPDLFEQSLRVLEAIPAAIIFSGHKGPVRDNLRHRLQQYRAVIAIRDRRCLVRLADGPRTVDELAHHWPIHGRQVEPQWLYGAWEKAMLVHQLARLERRGEVVRMGGHYCRNACS